MSGIPRFMLLLALLAAACAHERLERNAPGSVDLRAPPVDPSGTEPVRPRDPGDQGITFSVAPTFEGGLGWGGGRGARASGAIAFEAQAYYGIYSQSALDWTSFYRPLPSQAIGATGGAMVLHQGSHDTVWYAELQTAPLAFGWAWEGRRSGPIATLSAGPLFLRGLALGGGAAVHIGIAIPFSYSLIWSR